MRCNTMLISSSKELADKPNWRSASDVLTTARPLPSAKASMNLNTWLRSTLPNMSRTVGSAKLPLPKAMAWSVSDKASRIEPRAARAIRRNAWVSA